MGFLDKLKKNKQKQVEVQEGILMRYPDGTVAEVTFQGEFEMPTKTVHKAAVLYRHIDGTVRIRNVIMDQVTKRDENDWTIDCTEEHYKNLALGDSKTDKESKKRQRALMGFFEEGTISEEKLECSYIGGIAKDSQGNYFRKYDEAFKKSQIESTKRRNEQKQAKKDDKFLNSLLNEVVEIGNENKMPEANNIKSESIQHDIR